MTQGIGLFSKLSSFLGPSNVEPETDTGEKTERCKVWISGPQEALFKDSLSASPDHYCSIKEDSGPLDYLYQEDTSWAPPRNHIATLKTIASETKSREEILADFQPSQTPLNYRPISIKIPSFDGQHEIEMTFHMPNNPPPPGGYKIIPFFLGSAFRFKDMDQTPQRTELAEMMAQEGMCLVSIRYCVLSEVKDSFKSNPDQLFDANYYDEEMMIPDSVDLADNDPLYHMMKEAVVALEALSNLDTLKETNPDFNSDLFNPDIRVVLGTSSGGALAYTASLWSAQNREDPLQLILYNAAISARFDRILAKTVVGRKDMRSVQNGIIMDAAHGDVQIPYPVEIIDMRNINDELVNPTDHSGVLWQGYMSRGQSPQEHITEIIFDGNGGHNMTNLARSPEMATMNRLTVTAIQQIYSENKLSEELGMQARVE